MISKINENQKIQGSPHAWAIYKKYSFKACNPFGCTGLNTLLSSNANKPATTFSTRHARRHPARRATEHLPELSPEKIFLPPTISDFFRFVRKKHELLHLAAHHFSTCFWSERVDPLKTFDCLFFAKKSFGKSFSKGTPVAPEVGLSEWTNDDEWRRRWPRGRSWRVALQCSL